MAIIHLRKGDDFELSVACTRDDAPEDMTGWTLESSMLYSNCPPVELTMAWDDASQGLAIASLSDETTQSLHVGEYELQVRVINPDGKKSSSRPVTVVVRD